jgi:hypothetical protein
MKTINVIHQYNLGDAIYSLWALRKLAEKHDCKIDFLQIVDEPAFYYEGANHPTLNEKGQMVSINAKMLEMLKPLLETCPFINEVRAWKGEQGINLNRTREIQCNLPFGDIRRWIFYAFPDLTADLSEPVLNVPKGRPNDYILVNRTSRYRNPVINYAFLQRINMTVYFVGTLQEYSEFMNVVPKAQYVHCDNFKHLAIHINSAKFFIGNQSFAFSIAEALKVPRVLEACSFAPNVIPTGKHAYDYYDNQSFELIVKELVAAKDLD